MEVCKTNSNREDYGYPSGHATTGYLESVAYAMIGIMLNNVRFKQKLEAARNETRKFLGAQDVKSQPSASSGQ